MAFDKKRGLLAALEDFTEGAEGAGPADDDALMAATVEADTASEESVAELDELADTRESMDELDVEGDRLETLIDNVEATAPEGTTEPELTENEARFVAAEAADIYRRLGVKRSRMPATESFASPSSRKLATKIALEDWKEKAKEIGKAILEYIKQLIQKLVAAWQNLMGTGEKYKKVLVELEKKIRTYAPGEGKVSLGGLSKAFVITDASNPAKDVLVILENHRKATAATNQATNDFEAMAKSLSEAKADVGAKVTEGFEGIISKLGISFGEPTDKSYVTEVHSALAFGNSSTTAMIAGPYISNMFIGVGITEGGLKAKASSISSDKKELVTEANKPRQAELKRLIEKSKSLLIMQEAVQKNAGKITEFGKKVTAMIEKPGMFDGTDAAGAAKEIRKAALSSTSALAALYEIVPRSNISAVGKVIQFISVCAATSDKKED